MKKNCLIGCLILLLALIIAPGCGAAGNVSDQVVVIGQNGIYDLNSALNALGNNAGNAVIYLNGSTSISTQAEVPARLTGLKSITLASYTGSSVSVAMSGSVICANGVPFIVDQNVSLSNGYLVGGNCLAQSGNASVEESVLIINGSADYVIGGGLAMANGAVASAKNVTIIVNGNTRYVHGGGYAFNGGVTDVTGTANLIIPPTGKVNNALYGGGYAGGSGSRSSVNSAHVIALGAVSNINPDSGLAENGGSANVGSSMGSSGISLINRDMPKPVQAATPVPQIPQTSQTITRPYAGTTVMYVGPNQQAQNFTDAVNLLPLNAGNVEFRIMGNFRQDTDVVIPENRNIQSLKITGNNNARMTVSWPEDVGFFANGIPTEIDSSVVFKDGVIYGGANVSAGQKSSLPSTYLDIYGTVNKVVAGSKAKGASAYARVGNTMLIMHGKATGWLYGGGSALYGGHSVVEGIASMYVMPGASIDLSIAGGGTAFGAGSVSEVKDSMMDVSGSVIYAVFLGGYADQSSTAKTTGQAYLTLQPQGNVGQSVWYGGRAYNKSVVTVDTASAQISGRVGASVHKEGRASDGGSVSTRVIR